MASTDEQVNQKFNEQMENVNRDMIMFNGIQELIEKLKVS